MHCADYAKRTAGAWENAEESLTNPAVSTAEPGSLRSPTPLCQAVRFGDVLDVDAHHGFAQSARHLGDDIRVIEEGRGLDDGGCALRRVAGLEDARAHEYALGAQLHHHGRVRRSGDAARGEQHDGEACRQRQLP